MNIYDDFKWVKGVGEWQIPTGSVKRRGPSYHWNGYNPMTRMWTSGVEDTWEGACWSAHHGRSLTTPSEVC